MGSVRRFSGGKSVDEHKVFEEIPSLIWVYIGIKATGHLTSILSMERGKGVTRIAGGYGRCIGSKPGFRTGPSSNISSGFTDHNETALYPHL